MVAAVLDGGRSLDSAKADARHTALTGPERARAGDLAHAVLRWLLPIDARLAPMMRRAPDRRATVARDALRLAVAEVAVLGTPPHAAVDAAVRLAKADRPSAALAGLVNAVARRAVGDTRPLVAAETLPPWLAAHLAEAWDLSALSAALCRDAALDLSVRHPAEASAWAERLGGRMTPTGSVRLDAAGQLTILPGYTDGAWWVQDAAAALPARLLQVAPGEAVIDLCAAPGGKTLQLAAAGGSVTAVDADDRRLDLLQENLARTGLSATVVTADVLDWRPAALAPAVLLDAPCSATGTIRRHPDLVHLRRAADIGALIALQDRMLDAAWAMVERGGRLVYCTCSLLPEEGEVRAAAFLRRHDDARRRPVTGDEVGDPTLIDADGDLRTRPDMWPDGLDGFFAARFTKV